ncbi:hypothetical protein KC887_09480 [Candidatus Kaiserbacteria bacterium]|nr:hypothetical protein [Candidatus Kaiserbacteria bacterium]
MKKWELWQLIGHMIDEGWQPCGGSWKHPDGAIVDLNADDVSKRPYWHQLAERQQTPPTTNPPEHWGKKVSSS